ncbi:MAG: hypothetical protein OEY14_13825 [Myxococcales bacterium]|nr:hypothetical protein [Myxococcales bacterium]
MSLRELLTDPAKKEGIVQDCLEVLDAEVADKKGLAGVAVKAGFKVVKSFKPGFVKNVVSDLLPQFADAIEPIYEEAKSKGEPIARYLPDRSHRVAEALLAITDRKAARSQNRVIKGTYDKLRGSAQKHVEAAVPRLAGLIERHT